MQKLRIVNHSNLLVLLMRTKFYVLFAPLLQSSAQSKNVKKIRDYLPVLRQKQIQGDPNKCIVAQNMERLHGN